MMNKIYGILAAASFFGICWAIYNDQWMTLAAFTVAMFGCLAATEQTRKLLKLHRIYLKERKGA